MRLVFQKSIRERLSELIFKAHADRKEIEKIVLTRCELERLQYDCGFDPRPNGAIATFMGYPVEEEEEVESTIKKF